MPQGDGTGPWGLGPATGRRQGGSLTELRVSQAKICVFRGQNRWLLGAVAPLAVAAIRDLTNPAGLLHTLAARFLHSDRTKNPSHAIHHAHVEVLESIPKECDEVKGMCNNAGKT